MTSLLPRTTRTFVRTLVPAALIAAAATLAGIAVGDPQPRAPQTLTPSAIRTAKQNLKWT